MVGNPRVRSAYAPQPWSRRLLSLFLALALALTLTPLPAWGDETGDAPAEASAAKAIAEDSAAGLAESTARRGAHLLGKHRRKRDDRLFRSHDSRIESKNCANKFQLRHDIPQRETLENQRSTRLSTAQ